MKLRESLKFRRDCTKITLSVGFELYYLSLLIASSSAVKPCKVPDISNLILLTYFCNYFDPRLNRIPIKHSIPNDWKMVILVSPKTIGINQFHNNHNGKHKINANPKAITINITILIITLLILTSSLVGLLNHLSDSPWESSRAFLLANDNAAHHKNHWLLMSTSW